MMIIGNYIYLQSYRDIELMEERLSKYKRYCKYCNHGKIITENNKSGYVICDVCGHIIYKNECEEFKAMLKATIVKLKRKEREMELVK